MSLSSSRSGSRSRPFSSLVGYVAPRLYATTLGGSGGIPPLSAPGLSATTLRRFRGHSATVVGLAGVVVGGGR